MVDHGPIMEVIKREGTRVKAQSDRYKKELAAGIKKQKKKTAILRRSILG